jgi:hypothetical protein
MIGAKRKVVFIERSMEPIIRDFGAAVPERSCSKDDKSEAFRDEHLQDRSKIISRHRKQSSHRAPVATQRTHVCRQMHELATVSRQVAGHECELNWLCRQPRGQEDISRHFQMIRAPVRSRQDVRIVDAKAVGPVPLGDGQNEVSWFVASGTAAGASLA